MTCTMNTQMYIMHAFIIVYKISISEPFLSASENLNLQNNYCQEFCS